MRVSTSLELEYHFSDESRCPHVKKIHTYLYIYIYIYIYTNTQLLSMYVRVS